MEDVRYNRVFKWFCALKWTRRRPILPPPPISARNWGRSTPPYARFRRRVPGVAELFEAEFSDYYLSI
ncbi:MAG TPA: hypothetical protein DDZ83_02780 [Nitrospinae bacterium]|nr:hypothetical protein [Nitrospinota bacterium]